MNIAQFELDRAIGAFDLIILANTPNKAHRGTIPAGLSVSGPKRRAMGPLPYVDDGSSALAVRLERFFIVFRHSRSRRLNRELPLQKPGVF